MLQVGDQVKVLSGVDRGHVGRITRIYPGKHNGRWPYYMRVTLSGGKNIAAVVTRLEPYTPDEPPRQCWRFGGPLEDAR